MINPVRIEITRKELLNTVKILNSFHVWFHSELEGQIGMVINGVGFPIAAIDSDEDDWLGDLGNWDIPSLKRQLGM